MAALYSTRFLMASGVAGTFTYSVPNDRLAIIRSVVGLNGGAAGGYTMMTVAGVAVWIYAYPGVNQSRNEEMRLVVSPGETIGAVLSQQYMALTISGYLFPLGAGASLAAAGAVVHDETVLTPQLEET